MGNGKNSMVSDIKSMIEEFMKTPPKGTNSAKKVAIEARLMSITQAVHDLLEDGDSPETLDMLKAYQDQVKELVKGQE